MLWNYDQKNLLRSYDLLQLKKEVVSLKILLSQNILSTSHLTIYFQMYLLMQKAPCLEEMRNCIRANHLQSSAPWHYHQQMNYPKKKLKSLTQTFFFLVGFVG